MSSIPSFYISITDSIYGSSYNADSLVDQFASELGISPDALTTDASTEQAYLSFLAAQTPILQYMTTLTTQVLGSTANIGAEIALFRSSLGLSASDPLPTTDAAESSFASYLLGSNNTTSYLATLITDVYGSASAASNVLSGFRTSLGLLADQPIPDSPATQASFLSYLTSQSTSLTFISQFAQLLTGAPITDSLLQAFRGYLGLTTGEAIPDSYDTSISFITFLGQTNSFATYAATAVANAYGTSIVSNVALLSEFAAYIGLPAGAAIPSDSTTMHEFLYFLTSPTTVAAQAFYGISSEAATSIAAFRASLQPPLSSLTPIPTDDATGQQYLSYLSSATSEPAQILAQFMEGATQSMTGAAMTNTTLSQFRTFLDLPISAPLPINSSTESLFMSFLHQNLAAVGQAQAVNAVSPHSQAIQAMLFSAFSISLQMLNALEQATRVEAQALEIYAQWEEQYTNELTATPLYGPTDENQIVASTTNFGDTTLGAENVTVSQVAQWLYSQIQTTGQSSARFTIQNPIFNNALAGGTNTAGAPFPTFLLTKNSDGSYTFSLQAENLDPSTGNALGTYSTLLSASGTPSSLGTVAAQESALIGNIMKQMTDNWNNNNFVTPSFSVCVYNYVRDGSGNLITQAGGQFGQTGYYLPILTTDLKQAWSSDGPGLRTFNVTQYQNGTQQLPFDSSLTVDDAWGQAVQSHYLDGLFSPSGDATTLTLQQILIKGAAASAGSSWSLVSPYDGKTYTTQNATGGTLGTITNGTYAGDTVAFLVAAVPQLGGGPNVYTYQLYVTNSQNVEVYPIVIGYFTSADTSAGTGLWGPWNGPGGGAWPLTIQYPSSFSPASLAAVESQENSYIGELNAQLQQYVQGTQARSTNINNSMSVLQNLMTATSQATSNQSSLLDSIVQSFKSILSSIFTG